jgi:hypothetical protein
MYLHGIALGLVVEVTAEQREKVVHLGLEQLFAELACKYTGLCHGPYQPSCAWGL